MVKKDVALGVVAALLAAGYVIATALIPTRSTSFTAAGPQTFPYLVGGTLLVVSVGFLIFQILQGRTGPALTENDSKSDQAPQKETLQEDSSEAEAVSVPQQRSSGDRSQYSYIFMFLAALAYVALLGLLGFLLSTALFVAVGTVLVDKTKRYRGIRLAVPLIFGTGASIVLYLLFDEVLNVALPQGALGVGG